MVEGILTRRNATVKVKITVKTIISVALIALAVVLPQIAHLVGGAAAGMTWLPMYLPILIGGCLLGTYWGLGVGVLSPVVSYLITSAMGNPMPMLARLPYMIVELMLFAAISGLFSKKIDKNAWMAFPAVLLAQVVGRAVFLLLVACTQSISTLSLAVVWGQVQSGLVGLVLQAVIVPFVVMALCRLLNESKKGE